MSIKKLDQFILSLFIGRFGLTFFAAVFVLIMQAFLIWFDLLAGKDLGLAIYTELFFYLGISTTSLAFPLAILLAALISFGNLSEQCELIALKSASISLPRVLLPLVVFVALLSILLFFSNSYVVPKAKFKAYSLLYDLSQKKPALMLKEGSFCHSIPGYSIKVKKKLQDKKSFQDIIIYDHTKERGETSVTIADKAMVYTIHDGLYLVIELFNGHNYIEKPVKKEAWMKTDKAIPAFYRTSFETQKLILSLEAFQLSRTSEGLFYNTYMKNNTQLAKDIVGLKEELVLMKQNIQQDFQDHFAQHNGEEYGMSEPLRSEAVDLIDTTNILHLKAYIAQGHDKEIGEKEEVAAVQPPQNATTAYQFSNLPSIIREALEEATAFKSRLTAQLSEVTAKQTKINGYEIERYSRLSLAVSCLVMLLIGAPLGAIIRKGGLGIPLLVSTIFIMLHYIVNMFGTKWAKAGLINTLSGTWAANLVLFPFCLFFLQQAHKDARLLEAEFYAVSLEKMRKYFTKK